MPAFTEEEKRILLQTPIELILSHFGKRTEHSRGNMFYSPFRNECTPSFHINPNNNTWYDFGAGEGGGIIDIVTRLAGCSRSQAYDFLTSVRKDFVALSQYSHQKEKKKANRIDIASSRNVFRNRKSLRMSRKSWTRSTGKPLSRSTESPAKQWSSPLLSHLSLCTGR